MKIQSTRFGELEINESSIFTFCSPILGYEDKLKFVLLENKENSSLKWLHSVEDPDLAFVVTVAGYFGIDYTFELPENTQKILELDNVEDLFVLNMLVIPEGKPKESTINLLAPLVFNVKSKKVAQIVLTGSDYKIDHPLFQKEALC